MRALAAVLGLAVVLAGSAAAALPGKSVAKVTVVGSTADTAVSAIVTKPTGLWIRFAGKVRGGTAVVSCDRGFATVNDSYFYERAGVYRLPITPSHADTCTVFGGVAGGAGRVTVEIRAIP